MAMIEDEAQVEPLSSRGRAADRVFSFSNLSFTVTDRKTKQDKLIIHNLAATVQSGNIMAVLGPSGAGKTTLIKVLTLSAMGGTCRGSIALDDVAFNSNTLTRFAYVVAQFDTHWPFLTCRETILYAAQLYKLANGSPEQWTDHVIQKMGLEVCADTICGNEFIQGLSGGQKRRLSIALALIKQPPIIFLDEPTSGLDAAAATNVMRHIGELAKTDNLIVIATIHQPSGTVFDTFDQVMILSGGRAAYCGDAKQALEYFASIGHPVPQFTNPAEFYLDLVNKDFCSSDAVERVLDHWATRGTVQPDPTSRQSSIAADSGGESPSVAVSQQIWTMLKRHALLLRRDPVLFLGRALVMMFSNIYFAIVYIKVRGSSQDQVLNQLWLWVWHFGVPSQLGCAAVFVLNQEFMSIRREIKNGMISVIPYLVAKSVLEIPIMFLFGMFALMVSGYGIAGFVPGSLLTNITIFAAAIYNCEAMASVLSVAFDNPLLGVLSYMGFWFSSFLFGGFLIPIDDIIWPIRALAWILPMKYSLRGMIYSDFSRTDWNECDPAVDSVCWAASGEGKDVLDGVHNQYVVFSNRDTVGVDVLVLVGLALFLKVVYVFLMVRKSSMPSRVLPPLKDNGTAPAPGLGKGDSTQTEMVAAAAGAETPV